MPRERSAPEMKTLFIEEFGKNQLRKNKNWIGSASMNA